MNRLQLRGVKQRASQRDKRKRKKKFKYEIRVALVFMLFALAQFLYLNIHHDVNSYDFNLNVSTEVFGVVLTVIILKKFFGI